APLPKSPALSILMAAPSCPPVQFKLRSDFHDELGWTDFIRVRATTDPAFIRIIVANWSTTICSQP
ncbi:MAG: hypothetical protein PSU94_00235, partial [Lacunisphaera sp.]|nr:hypothetical protein [Lacunisphaera sp.]